MSTGVVAPRPWYLTLIGVLGIIQGVFAVIGGIALVVERSEAFFDRARGG